jgi:hypothetical protein
VATTFGVQDFSQLRKDFGKEQADVILNITGNIISGQMTSETAKQLSERLGEFMQDRFSFSINSSDTFICSSKQLDSAILPPRIAALSSGKFVGMVADNPEKKIALKMFHAEVKQRDAPTWENTIAGRNIHKLRSVKSSQVMDNFHQVKLDIRNILVIEIYLAKARTSTVLLMIVLWWQLWSGKELFWKFFP